MVRQELSTPRIESIEPARLDSGIHEDRRLFLRAAAMHAEIRLGHSLWESVFSLWSNPPPGAQEDQFSAANIAYVYSVRRALWAWARQHSLGVYWVISAAYGELQSWSMRRDQGLPLNKDFTSWHPIFAEPPEFEWPHWLPTRGETEREYRDKAMAQFRKALEEYVLETKKARKGGRDRRTRNVHPDQRFTWAALRVCCGWTYEKIAGECVSSEGVSVQTVHRTVRDLCRRLELST